MTRPTAVRCDGLTRCRQAGSYETPYGGSVAMSIGVAPSSRRVTSPAEVASPHSSRWRPSDEQLAADNVGGTRFDDRVLVGQASASASANSAANSVVGPERRQIEPVGLQLLQHVDIPFEVEFADAVVGDGERLCARDRWRDPDRRAGQRPDGRPSVFTTRSGMLSRFACSTVLLPAMILPWRSIRTARPGPYSRSDRASASRPRSVPRFAFWGSVVRSIRRTRVRRDFMDHTSADRSFRHQGRQAHQARGQLA